MKSIVDSNGELVCTFEGGDVNMDDPAFKDCKIVDGDAPLKALEAKAKAHEEERLKEVQAERDEEHSHLHELEERIKKLEESINNQ